MARNVHAEWIDLVAELLREPLTDFPHEAIALQLRDSFAVTAVSWDWREDALRQGGQLFSDSGSALTQELMDAWHTEELMSRHPLRHWLAATGDLHPQTAGRVPNAIAPVEDVALMVEILGPYGVPEQLAIPYRCAGDAFALFALGRPEGDFSDHDVELATRLQPLLVGLSRQARAQAGCDGAAAAQVSLTGTELAVLALLNEGHTASGIASRLGNSPRTVGKHLEHIYRKLGVSDRLLATRAATELGLLRQPPSD